MQHQNHDGVLENINVRESCLVIKCSVQKDLWQWINFRKAWKCLKSLTRQVYNIILFKPVRGTSISENLVLKHRILAGFA